MREPGNQKGKNACRFFGVLFSGLVLIALLVSPAAPQVGVTYHGEKPPTKAMLFDTWQDPRTGIVYCYVKESDVVVGSSKQAIATIRRKIEAKETKPEEDVTPPLDEEIPPRQYHLKAFWMAQYEITNEQYERFLHKVKSIPVPSLPEGYEVAPGDEFYVWDPKMRKAPVGRERYPVTYIRPENAAAFCRWAHARLPTEAQWERAAGAAPRDNYGDNTPAVPPSLEGVAPAFGFPTDAQGAYEAPRQFPWGNRWHWWLNSAERRFEGPIPTVEALADWEEEQHRTFHTLNDNEARQYQAALLKPVGSFLGDHSWFGCYDMGGNVAEICLTSDNATRTGSPTPSWKETVIKGGSFESPWWECRVQSRAHGGSASKMVGFRCVYDAGVAP